MDRAPGTFVCTVLAPIKFRVIFWVRFEVVFGWLILGVICGLFGGSRVSVRSTENGFKALIKSSKVMISFSGFGIQGLPRG